jgi:hemolysin III
MHEPTALNARRLAEEVANSLTHGLGLVLSLVGLVPLLLLAAVHDSMVHLAAAAVYGATLVALYAASTLYHACREPRRKHLFRVVDHCAIYLLIAGTYTPFALLSIPAPWGRVLLVIVWTLAAVGVLYKVFMFGRFPRLALALYLGMGWLAVLAIRPILAHVPPIGVALMVAGGLLYTAGVWFYVRDHMPYRHAIWHLFVLGGSACHYFAVLASVLPPATV